MNKNRKIKNLLIMTCLILTAPLSIATTVELGFDEAAYERDFKEKKSKELWLNSLDCREFSTAEVCNDINEKIKHLELSNYQKMTFDNQLKKISFLIRNDKEKIAIKRYDYFLKSLYSSVDDNISADIKDNRENIWELIKNYSLSDKYQANPKYKL